VPAPDDAALYAATLSIAHTPLAEGEIAE